MVESIVAAARICEVNLFERVDTDKIDEPQTDNRLEHYTDAHSRARQHGELTGKPWAAIDVTKGFPFAGDADDHDDDILGYNGNA